MKNELTKLKIKFKDLMQADYLKFPKIGQGLEAPVKKGVYIIFSPFKKILHVGCTPRAKYGLHQRLKNHLSGQSSFVEKYLKGNSNKLRKGYFYKFLIVHNDRDDRERKLLEAYAIGQLCPEHIGKG